MPLNSKAMIQDFVGALGDGSTGYAGHGHPGREPSGQGEPLLPVGRWVGGGRRSTRYAVGLHHVPGLCRSLSDDDRACGCGRRSAPVRKAAGVLEELRAADNPGGLPLSRRIDWASDLALPLAGERDGVDVLLWLGDEAFDLRGQQSLRAFIKLLHKADVDFAVLGEEERDCGDLARRLGDEATFQDLARRNIATLEGVSFKRIVTMDPHALHVLRNEYPAFGGVFDVVHHTQFLLDLVEEGRLTLKGLPEALTYHDPCYLDRYNGEKDAPRKLLDALGVELREMEFSGKFSRCCGGGGGAPVTDIAGDRRIPDVRMDQARETGAACVAVACPNCTVMLEGVVGPRPQVREITELVLEAAI
ncbi:MAG: (Fe-S)-binding protein [Breoghania sp.]|nr:(Fe-S)-binding protein [Breoghania sp.]